MKILGMDHIALPVGDLDVAEDFYTRIMGGEVVRRIGDTESDKKSGRVPQVIIKVADSVKFNLTAAAPDVPEGHFPHWAFMGRFEDIDEWIETFKKEGIKHYGPYGHGGVGRLSLYFHDPVGYLFELGMDVADWETAKAEINKRGGLFGSTESTYNPDEWDRNNAR